MAKRLISSQSYIIPFILALGVEFIVLVGLFVSWSNHAEIPTAKPTMVATLYEVTSKSPATTQTSDKIAGQAEKTKAPLSKEDQVASQRDEQKKIAEQQSKEKAQADVESKKKVADAKAKAEAKVKADAELKKKVADAKAKAEAKVKTDAESKKKAADTKAKAEAKAKADLEAKKKAADAKAKAEAKTKADAAARKAREDKEAAALADLLGDSVERGSTKGDRQGSQVVGSIDDLIKQLVKDNWTELGNPVPGTSVELVIQMLPDGTITNVTVSRTSGNAAFDNSAVNAAKNIGRIPEIQTLDSNTFNQLYRQRKFIFTSKGL